MTKFASKVLLLLILFPSTLFSQQGLESRLFMQLKELRAKAGLKDLKLDETLMKAAEDQAYYMYAKHKTMTFQSTFSKETPSERVAYYGGNRTYVSEVVGSFSFMTKSRKKLGVEAVADSLFGRWVKDEDKLRDLLDPNLTKMGLAYKKYKSIVYVSLVMSSNEIKLPDGFKEAPFSYGVRPAKKTCKDESQTYETMTFANGVHIEGNEIYFYFHDKSFFKKVIKGDNDGMALDIVTREQMPCNKENQFHVSEVYDGEMQQPIYKNDIYRSDISENPNKILFKVGEVPEYLQNKQWEANIIVINKNKLCDYSIPTEVPADIFPLLELHPYLELDQKIDSSDFKPDYSIKVVDSMHVELHFNREEDKYTAIDWRKYNKLFSWGPYANTVDVNVYASVEGTNEINKSLLVKRKKSIKELLLKAGFREEEISMNGAVNWALMEQQIKKDSISALEGRSHLEIQNYFKENPSPYFDSLLFEQRKTHIHAYLDTTIKLNSYQTYKMGRYYDKEVKSGMMHWNKILREEFVLKDKRIPTSLIIELKNEREVRTNLLAALMTEESYRALDSANVQELIRYLDRYNSKQVFNYANFLTHYWFDNYTNSLATNKIAKSMPPEDIRKLVSRLSIDEFTPEDLVRLQVNILLSGIHYYVSYNEWDNQDQYFKEISNLIQVDAISPEEAYELALFCNYFHRFEVAVDILRPFFQEGSLSKDALFALAQTSTLIRSELDEEEYHSFMEAAKKADRSRYCKWLDGSFQIQRDETLKKDFCRTCQ